MTSGGGAVGSIPVPTGDTGSNPEPRSSFTLREYRFDSVLNS